MDDDRKQRWAAHCHRMAEATHAIADWCEDPHMMESYLELAASWIQLAQKAPPETRARRALTLPVRDHTPQDALPKTRFLR